ncbi:MULTISPECIES: GlsB/YeaQ/YmgE family stress response membrane protein [unclassified Frankia]|uniref:GlsB/YeaQ/YmgE family stress response membrane protein n=1 Tax=unclassified Frankia TaxID=2632575 RepID=UPI0020243A7A
MVEFIIVTLLLGLVVGAVARLVLPGPDRIGIGGTIIVGIVGSFVGGFLGYALFNKDAGEGPLQPSGVVGSVIGAVLVLLAWRAVNGRGSYRHQRYVRR